MSRRNIFKMKPVIKYRCPNCGSSEIGCTANVYWDESKGMWSFDSSDFGPENECWCSCCDLEFSADQAEEAARQVKEAKE